MTTLLRFLRMTFIVLVLAGCASQVRYTKTEFSGRAATNQQVLKTLAKPASVELDTGYQRFLKAGSQWTHIGTVAQGDVYKPYKDVFTLEGAYVHEAYLVVTGGQLVGFYMPVEQGFSPLARKVRLELN